MAEAKIPCSDDKVVLYHLAGPEKRGQHEILIFQSEFEVNVFVAGALCYDAREMCVMLCPDWLVGKCCNRSYIGSFLWTCLTITQGRSLTCTGAFNCITVSSSANSVCCVATELRFWVQWLSIPLIHVDFELDSSLLTLEAAAEKNNLNSRCRCQKHQNNRTLSWCCFVSCCC